MKFTVRVLAAAAAVFLLGLLPAPEASAATMVANIDDVTSYEHELACNVNQPGPCNVRYQRALVFTISVSNFSGSPITFNFRAEGITATPGVDFVPWPYAPPDRVTTDSHGYARVRLDIVVDQAVEPTETVRLRLTGASRPVDLSDTGLGTILDHNQIPRDCVPSVIDVDTGSMTCSARPAGQRWQARFECGGFPPPWAGGNVVTGNGTSTAMCVYEEWMTGYVRFTVVG